MALFLTVAVPFCVGIGYVHPPRSLGNVWIDGIARFLSYFFLNTLIFEFLYRGVIQNLVHSALDFHHESRQYLFGRADSLTDVLNQFDESPVIGVLNPNGSPLDDNGVNGHDLLQRGPPSASSSAVKLVDSSKSINNYTDPRGDRLDDTVDLESLPYFDGNRNESMASRLGAYVPYIATLRDSVWKCGYLRFQRGRDWVVIVASSLLYAVTVIDYKNYEETSDLVLGAMFMFWLGICCGTSLCL